MTNPSSPTAGSGATPTSKRKNDAGRRRSVALRLLDGVLAAKQASDEVVAAAMMVDGATLAEYRQGQVPIPLEAQMLLAAFAIERVPTCARLGHQLRGELRARIAFAAGETETHMGPPPSARFW